MTVLLLASLACEKKPDPGFLNVAAAGDGAFEIYRIAKETPLHVESEQVGKFNADVPLLPGSYLVLADCSSETVIIYPGQRASMVAHRVEFVPPHQPNARDSFGVQCSRSDKTKSRQLFSSRYELNLIHGKRDILVGMVPLHIDFTTMPDTTKPKTLSYKLSAIQVADFAGDRQEASYFISPADELIAATNYQQFGHWEFLLPGPYALEVNGTRMQVQLAAGEERIIKPALFKVTTSNDIDLDLPSRVKGSPWLVEMNTGHWLNFNETYPVLPGTASVSIEGSTQSVDVELHEGEEVELKTRSIMVDSGCDKLSRTGKGEVSSCLGERGVSLYLPDEPYPFIESVSDIPIIFIDQGSPVLVGVDGSRDIIYQVPASVRDRTLQLGYARLLPQPQHRPGQLTDLVRVDSLNQPFEGHTLDVNLERNTLMPLISGTYKLDQFLTLSATGEGGSRTSSSRNFVIEAGKTIEIEFAAYYSEKKFLALKKKHPSASTDDSRPFESRRAKHLSPARLL